MLRPIPAKILRSTATVSVCDYVNVYQNQHYQMYTVQRVHLQPTERIVKGPDNTDRQMVSLLFVDARISAPQLDWLALLREAHEHGGDMRVSVRGVEYTVLTVDELRDVTDQLHHWEIGLG